MTSLHPASMPLRHDASWDAMALPRLVAARDVHGRAAALSTTLQSHSALLQRLACSTTLTGHRGCVNHLRWNHNGSLLASGSDDTKLIVWDYATKQARETIETGHVLNIFAVCFVPGTNDHVLATGAMDKEVRIHYAPFRTQQIKRFPFHRGRVKDIASSPHVPQVFWSVAEDGLVYQFDLRALPPSNGVIGDDQRSGVLIRLGKDRNAHPIRGMAMAVHPLDATKVVVACGDFYTRLFDRRMLRSRAYTVPQVTGRRSQHRRASEQEEDNMHVENAGESVSPDATVPVEVFAPPHLHLDHACDYSTRCNHDEAHGTSIQFNHDGSEILANFHNDHIYLFRTQQAQQPCTTFKVPNFQVQTTETNSERDSFVYGLGEDQPAWSSARSIEAVRLLSSQGLVTLLNGQYTQALDKYNDASCSSSFTQLPNTERKELYHDMAKAYLGRKWRADDYMACVHARYARRLDPQDRSVELTYVRALHASKRTRHAEFAAKQYQRQYPSHSDDVDEILQEIVTRRRRSTRTRPHMHFMRQSSSSSSEDDDEDDEEEEDEEEKRDEDEEANAGIEAALFSNIESVTSGPRDIDRIAADDTFWANDKVNGLRVNCEVERRYVGYCNLQTDIKEANFFGPNDACVVAGSDDGRAYIWDKHTGKLINAIEADADIVNCVQPHPFDTCLATSGIENVIRLWTPIGHERSTPSRAQLDEWAANNQDQMVESSNYYVSASNPNIIRLLFQASENEGYQECATS